MSAGRIGLSPSNNLTSLVPPLALLGIPVAGGIAILFLPAIPQMLNGRAGPLMAAAGIAGWIIAFTLVFLLRSHLESGAPTSGFYRDVLDFLSLSRWHPATWVTLIALIVLPQVWYLYTARDFFMLIHFLGRNVLRSGDFRDDLERIAVTWQLCWMAGVPLLFCLHMISRWKPRRRFLPWLLIPVLFFGVAFGVLVLVVINH